MPSEVSQRHYLDLAAAFVRGRLGAAADLPAAELFRAGESAGLRLHKFKRSALLPRIRRVFGFLQQLAPETLLDVGSGRGVFLWPLLDTFPHLRVHCVDIRPDRVADLQAVAAGGIDRLTASEMDIALPNLPAHSFEGVTMLEVLEHLPRPSEAVTAAVRLARRFVLVSVPSKPDDNPEHIHLFDRDSLTALFHAVGIENIRIDYVLNHIVALALVRP